MAPHGRSGGILLGVDLSVFDIGAIDEGGFMSNSPLDTSQLTSSLSFILFMDRYNHKTRVCFLPNSLIPAQRRTFLFSLAGILILCENLRTKAVEILILNSPPFLMMSSSPLILGKLSWQVASILVGVGDNLTYEKLDRVLASTEWEINFPLAKVEARDRNISDHTPLVVSTGASTQQSGSRPFRFERGGS
jgi:hypothetical protein